MFFFFTISKRISVLGGLKRTQNLPTSKKHVVSQGATGSNFLIFLSSTEKLFVAKKFSRGSTRIKFFIQAHPVTSVLQTTMVSVFLYNHPLDLPPPSTSTNISTHVIMNVMDWCHSLLCHGQH